MAAEKILKVFILLGGPIHIMELRWNYAKLAFDSAKVFPIEGDCECVLFAVGLPDEIAFYKKKAKDSSMQLNYDDAKGDLYTSFVYGIEPFLRSLPQKKRSINIYTSFLQGERIKRILRFRMRILPSLYKRYIVDAHSDIPDHFLERYKLVIYILLPFLGMFLVHWLNYPRKFFKKIFKKKYPGF